MTIAFIVDGHLEKLVIQRLCGDAPVRMTNMNGRSVSLSKIADQAETFIRLFRGRCFPIVIIVDREGRSETSAIIEDTILDYLEKKGYKKDNFIISSPDRMIENWILAGTEEIGGEAFDYGRSADDVNGKSELRKILSNIGASYGERTTGVEMLCRMNFTKAAQNSDSYQRLHVRLSTYCQKLRS